MMEKTAANQSQKYSSLMRSLGYREDIQHQYGVGTKYSLPGE